MYHKEVKEWTAHQKAFNMNSDVNRIVDRFSSDLAPSTRHRLTKGTFKHIYAVGKGGYGKVWRVKTPVDFDRENTEFAMKEMAKGRIMLKKSTQTVMNELNVLTELKSKFIVNAHYAF